MHNKCTKNNNNRSPPPPPAVHNKAIMKGSIILTIHKSTLSSHHQKLHLQTCSIASLLHSHKKTPAIVTPHIIPSGSFSYGISEKLPGGRHHPHKSQNQSQPFQQKVPFSTTIPSSPQTGFKTSRHHHNVNLTAHSLGANREPGHPHPIFDPKNRFSRT